MKSFKEIMTNEELDIEELDAELDDAIVEFILISFALRNQTHIYHLLTKSYAEHIAIGEFYESLEDCVDDIAEMAIGLGVEPTQNGLTSELTFTYSKESLLSDVETYRENISEMIEDTNDGDLMSIQDSLISIQKSIDTLLYKLQLN